MNHLPAMVFFVLSAVHVIGQLSSPPSSAAPQPVIPEGALLFHNSGCEHCHGVNGVGTEKGPSLASVGRRLKPESITRQIEVGGGGMPAFGDALQPDEIQRLVDFLASKKDRSHKARPRPAIGR